MMQMHQTGLEFNLNEKAVLSNSEKQEIKISINDYDAFDQAAQDAEKLVISCRENARFLINHLNKYSDYFELPKVIDDVLYLALSIRVRENVPFEKADLIKHLSDAGIEARNNYGFLPTSDNQFHEGKNNRMPVANKNQTSRFCIPCHQYLTIPNLQQIVGQFDTFFEQWCGN